MKENNVKSSVIGGLVWKFGERFLSQGVSFVISLVLARLLAPDDYGTIALVTVFINLAAVFISSGFATALIQKKDADDTDFSTIFICSLVASCFIYGILYFCSPFIAKFYDKEILTSVLRVFALQVPLGVYNSVQNAYVSRNMLFRKLFFSTVISSIVSGCIGIIMAFGGFGVWALVAQSIAFTIVNTIVLAFSLPWHPQLKFSMPAAKNMMKYGSRILGADLSGTFFGEVRSLIIGRVYTSADLAYYNKGQQLPTLITSNLSNSVMSVMFPALSNQHEDLEQVKRMAKRSLQVLSFVLVPCLFGLSAVMEPLILLLYTEKWAATIPYGQVLCIGSCIGVLGIIPLQVFKAIGHSDVVLKLEIWKKPVYVILLIVSVNINVFAIAIFMTLYDFYGVFVNMLQMKKYINYSMHEQFKDLFPAIALGVGMMTVVLVIPAFESAVLTLFAKVFVGAIVYVGGAALFKVEAFRYLLNTVMEVIKR